NYAGSVFWCDPAFCQLPPPPSLAGWTPRPRALWMTSPMRYEWPFRRPDHIGQGPIFLRLPSLSPTRRTTRVTSSSRTSQPAMTTPPPGPVSSTLTRAPPPASPHSDPPPSFVCLTVMLLYHVALSGWTTALQGYADPSASFPLGAPLPIQVIFLEWDEFPCPT
ncbi:unnamed protein product, partial [Ixodes pacificus]